jgi:PAS domain S-box-containing protein
LIKSAMLRILYIEDDPAHIELTRRSLEIDPAEFELNTALTIKDALDLLDTTGYDVILCDHRLPDGSGLDVIKLVHERGITTALVLITNQEDTNTAIAALKAGAVDYVVKQSDYLLKLPIVLSNAYSVTQLEKQKSALIESQNKYQNIYENSMEGVFQSTPDGRYLDLNPAMAHIYGYESPKEMLENVTNISTQIHADGKTRQEFNDLLSDKGFVKNFEAQNLRKDGSIIWTSTNARTVKNKSGNILYFEGFLTDITERKHSEERLERQLKELTVLHATSIAGAQSNSEDEIIERVTRITSSIYSEVCGVLLLNDLGNMLTPHPSCIGANISNWQKGYPTTDGITGRAVTMGKSIRIGDVTKDPSFIEIASDINSELCVPFWALDRIIGVFNVESKRINAFGEEDERLLNTIAGGLGTAIEKLRLFNTEQKRRAQAEILREATEALTTTIDLDKLFEIIFDSLAKLVQYDSASIELIYREYFEIVAGRYISKELIGKKYTTDPKRWGGVDGLRQPLVIRDVQADERFEKFKGSEYIRGWMGIPLFSQGKLIGYLNLDSKIPGFFKEDQTAIAQTFSNQAAIAIENAQLFQRESRRSQIIESLANIANEIATTREIIPALDKIAERALSLLNASTIAVYLLQDDNETIKIVTARGAYQKELIAHTIKAGEGITGRIIACGIPEIIDNISQDLRKIRVPGTPEEDAKLDTLMSAPLILHGKTIGAINAWRLISNGLFDKSELNFLVSIAHQASISIESVRLFEETNRRAQEAAAIAKVGRDISATLQIDIVLERIASYAKNLLKAETSAVYLSEPGTTILRAVSAIGIDSVEIKNDPLQTGVGILGNIALQKLGEIVNDTIGDPRTITIKGTEINPLEHIMGVPILSKDKLTGLLVVWRSGIADEFQSTELNFLSSLAQQAAVAIENARLFELEQRHRKEAEDLSQATSVLANTFDINHLFEKILDWLAIIVPYDSASIMINYENKLKLVAKRNLPDQFSIGQEFMMTEKWKEVVTNRHPFIMEDAQKDPLFEKWEGSDYIHGWMAVAMFTKDSLIGFINLDSRRAGIYTEEQATLVQTFANQAATALENARLFEAERKRRREAENLRLAATAITSSLDPKEVLETILTALQQVVPFDSATMMRLEDGHVRIVAAQGFSNNDAILNLTFPANNKLLLVIDETQRPLILDDATNDTRFENWAGANLTRGWMGIPLIVHGKIIGYITLDSETDGAFDPNAATLAQTFALQAAAAIDNTQLFENLQRSNQELSIAYDTTLEGWGKALELRDKETHGHTHRVTDLTMKLARFMGLSKAELTLLRRGVLLHDIGKMGVSDEILHKKGPLTKEEWIEMRKHPQYAFDLLYPISFLRPSLEIPYSHHEWWDGSGYPRGLRGEEIPLAARIFAIVDVWDALLSNRPYRKAWTQRKVINYIQTLSGKQFDPQVVPIFMHMINPIAKSHEKSRKSKTSKQKDAASIHLPKKSGKLKKK